MPRPLVTDMRLDLSADRARALGMNHVSRETAARLDRFVDVLLHWQRRTLFKNPEDWVFASPFTSGKTPWYPWGVERRHIIPAAIRCGIGSGRPQERVVETVSPRVEWPITEELELCFEAGVGKKSRGAY